jgi:hypothetical protein
MADEYVYDYVREQLPDGQWDINYPGRLTTLPEDVKASSLDVTPTMICAGTSCKLFFLFDLDAAQKTVLDGVVAAHKSNT